MAVPGFLKGQVSFSSDLLSAFSPSQLHSWVAASAEFHLSVFSVGGGRESEALSPVRRAPCQSEKGSTVAPCLPGSPL